MGNYGYNLSQLLQRGYPVVPGFVVPTSVFWDFIERLGKSEPMLADLPHSSFHLDVDNPRQLQQVAQQLRQAITTTELPKELASSLLAAAELVPASAMIFHPSLSLPSTTWQVSKSLAQRGVSESSPGLIQVEREVKFGKLFAQWSQAQIEGLQELPGSQLLVERGVSEANRSVAHIEGSDVSANLQPGTPHDLQSSKREPVGVLESRICPHQPEALLLSLKQAWAELFRARSLFYWQRNGIGLQQLNLTVLVQPLWNAIASGTIEATPNEWKIQATWGIGIAIAKGEVLPDFYQVQPQTGTVQAQVLGSKTRAYRLSNEQEPNISTATALQAYLLSEEHQKQYALEDKYLKQLIELSQQLATEFGCIFGIEWTLCQIPGHLEPQLYLTKFSPQPSAKSSQVSMSTQPSIPKSTPQVFRGLPAATGQVTAPAQVIRRENQNLEVRLPGRILVAQQVTPDWLPWLKQAAGIVTERGGMTSHAAIIARELGIPAVVGAAGVTQFIQTGEPLSVDGDRGEIQRLELEQLNVEAETCLLPNFQISPIPNRPYPIATQLLVNVSQPDSLEKIVSLPVDGIGLLRSELMMLSTLENRHYAEWLRQGRRNDLVARLVQTIIRFASVFAPRPVFYRSMDWRSNEFQFLIGAGVPTEPEVNPMLGLRGTRHYQSDPTYFDMELAALGQVHASGYTNIQLLLPFVRTVEEFTFCRRRVEQAGLFDNPHFQLWIMAEVPSILFLLPDYVKAGVQGISIGTNDLTQLLLAVDRDQEQLGSTLNGHHPAVRRALKQLIETAKLAGIPCSICGQAPTQHPELIDSLVEWGITSISVDVNYVEQTYTAIARAEQRLLLEAARQTLNNSNT